MNTICNNRIALLAAIFFITSNLSAQQHSLEKLWETEAVLDYTECAVMDKGGKFMYVSNVIGSPFENDGVGSISIVGIDGKIINKDWITGLNAPKGMDRYKDLLYVAELTEVLVVDIKQTKVVQHIPIEGAALLHNISVDSKGVVYVSDMFANKVFRIEDGKVSVYLEEMQGAAGLLAIGSDLYVLTQGKLQKTDADKNLTTVSEGMDFRMNGIALVKENEFLVTNWGGLVYYINADGSHQVLIDRTNERIAAGIICYDAKSKMMYMPTDGHNVVEAYRLK